MSTTETHPGATAPARKAHRKAAGPDTTATATPAVAEALPARLALPPGSMGQPGITTGYATLAAHLPGCVPFEVAERARVLAWFEANRPPQETHALEEALGGWQRRMIDAAAAGEATPSGADLLAAADADRAAVLYAQGFQNAWGVAAAEAIASVRESIREIHALMLPVWLEAWEVVEPAADWMAGRGSLRPGHADIAAANRGAEFEEVRQAAETMAHVLEAWRRLARASRQGLALKPDAYLFGPRGYAYGSIACAPGVDPAALVLDAERLRMAEPHGWSVAECEANPEAVAR